MRRINRDRPRLGPVLALFVALIALTTAATVSLAARNESAPQPAAQPDSALAGALLQQAWPQVADLLDSEPSLPPAMQFIRAHTLTALNQPNASLCTLLAASSQENIAAWYAWAQDFQARHPQSAVAYYLLGDALARRGDLDGAVTTFTAGLQIEPANPLLLNARGTAYAIQGNRQAAREDLVRVASGDSPLVDAQVSAGSLIIDRRGGTADARSWFDRALGDQQPDDALALYGRAITWVAEGNWEQANADLQAALASAPCMAPVIAKQLEAMQSYIAGGADVALAEQDAESGFALERVINPFLSNPTPQNASALLAYLGPNPQELSTATTILRAYSTTNPRWAAIASQQLNQAAAFSSSVQPIYERLYTAPGAPLMQPGAPLMQPGAQLVPPGAPLIRPGAPPIEAGAPLIQSSPWMSAAPGTMVYAASLPNPNSTSNQQVIGTLRDAIGPGVMPGGFDASLYEASFDRGDWPAVTYYGLLYPATPEQASR